MRKRANWFWGVFLVLGAVVLVTSQLGIFSYHVGLWPLLLAVFLVAAFVESLMHLAVWGMVFSLAFLAIIFAKPLGIAALAPWTILIAAVLLSLGLSLIIRPKRWYHYDWRDQGNWSHHHHRDWSHHGEDDVETLDDSAIVVDVNMSNSIRYLQSSDFRQADVRVSMGNAKLYFDDVTLSDGGALINVDAHLGGIQLYLPTDWNVKVDVDADLGSVETTGEPAGTTGPTVMVKGRVSLGGLGIVYI